MELKYKLEEYRESEFIELISKIILDKGLEDELDSLLENFINVSEHPNGSDLIYYPEEGADDSPEGILAEIKKWRAENGKPGFKE
ncbi:colicin immunity / pyocin immunity family protein [Yersinia rochesterensis]|uniref:Bacteriocin immunity protein n=1 Tax=Yersinia rochesterensis TaxID=1604335 RepID=A0A386HA14_9GAMM|nr:MULTISPECIES: bacteriocin immunity protein [Yersinia]AJI88322.1 immunity protein [Yersinia frederiksenii Y225]CNI05426.1 colicin immunity protein [Yersinia kristensenii]AIN16793.1 immunity protein [Yersinia rochesterensis]AJJ37380.1 colicin immunity / pyocin immunity family protein [Yersinia rochesterensis]AYD42433.1 bacteriocin immunity protein [Yersinia rochesterensis]